MKEKELIFSSSFHYSNFELFFVKYLIFEIFLIRDKKKINIIYLINIK